MMYFVDRKKIEETLRFFEEQYDLMRSHQTWSSPLEKSAGTNCSFARRMYS